jgi:hypothetical protein
MTLEPLAGQRQKKESSKAVQACNDYLRAGPGRSLVVLCQQYSKSHQESPPTLFLGTLKKWSSRYGWAERAESYDAKLEQQKTERAQEIMQSGLALDHERVVHLKHLSSFLEDQIYEQGKDGVYHNVWLPDVKQIGSGETAERVDIERFNSALIDQYRGTLDDLAKETGGRKTKTEHSGPDGGPIETKTDVTSSEIDRGIAEALALLGKVRERSAVDDSATDNQ